MRHIKMDIYQQSLSIPTIMCDLRGELKISEILGLFQEVAITHADILGCGEEYMRSHNAAWVLTRMQIKVHRYPRIGEKVLLHTWPTRARRQLFPRFYALEGENGDTLAVASSIWVVLDLSSRKMILPEGIAGLLPSNENIELPIGMPGGVKRYTADNKAYVEYLPLYTDFDVNGHVTNTRYADWVCNALGLEVMREYAIGNLNMCYHREVLPEMLVNLEVCSDEKGFGAVVQAEDKIYFDCHGTLFERLKTNQMA